MKFKFKHDIEEGSVGISNGFFYDITHGGYIDPHELLEDPEQAEAVLEAAAILMEFEDQLCNEGLMAEF